MVTWLWWKRGWGADVEGGAMGDKGGNRVGRGGAWRKWACGGEREGVHVLCHFPWSCYYCRICVDINSSSSEVISMLATIPCTRQGSTVTIERKWKFPPIFLSSLKVQDMKIFFRERWKKKCVCTIFFLIHLQPREKYLKSITLRKLFIIFLNSKNIGKFY